VLNCAPDNGSVAVPEGQLRTKCLALAGLKSQVAAVQPLQRLQLMEYRGYRLCQRGYPELKTAPACLVCKRGNQSVLTLASMHYVVCSFVLPLHNSEQAIPTELCWIFLEYYVTLSNGMFAVLSFCGRWVSWIHANGRDQLHCCAVAMFSRW
jgi:hypothetical protein